MSKKLTEQQKAAAYTIGEDLCVDAGAGSGKTTVLVERVMYLLDRGIDLRRIVAITFTRKAAGEMKERLREAIHLRPENDPRSMDKWRALELEVETARITTIDGFCSSLLHENALRIGLDPDFSTLGEEEAPLLRGEVAQSTLIALLDKDDPGAHRLVVEHGFENLAAFLSNALDQGERFEASARPYAGLDAAALVVLWKTQAEDLEKLRYETLASSTDIHRINAALTVLAGECNDASDKREIARRDALRFIGMVCDSANLHQIREGFAGLSSLNFRGGSAKAWSSKESMQSVKTAAEEARDLAKELKEPEYSLEIEIAAAQLTLDLIAVFAVASVRYREAKLARTAMDFGDLLNRTVHMLRGQPDLCARIAGGIDHLLIDEFQDTNQAQLELARLLADEDGAELFVVGDAKQSVYRFRGAQVEVFAQVKRITHRTLRLDENFRSIAPLIAFINDFFHESRLLAGVEREFHRLSSGRNESHKGPCIEFLLSDESDADPALDSGELHDESWTDRCRQAELVAGRIEELCSDGGAEVYDKASKTRRSARFGDIAILYRAGTHAEIYEAALRARGIPANVIAGAGFFARQEILDLHNLFTAALDPWNEPALAAFLRSPFAGVSDDTLMRLSRESTLAAAFRGEICSGDETEDAILSRARALLDFIRARREEPVAALLRELLAETGIEAILLSQYHGAQKAGNIHKLIDLARNFGGAGRLGLHAFAQHLSSLARTGLRSGDAELLASADGAVTLMNVHKAKGLEFPIVAIVEMGRPQNAGRQTPLCLLDPRRGMAVVTHDERGATACPAFANHLRRLDKEDDRAEEARVLYVAMTRARDRLLFVGPAEPKKNTWMSAINAVFAVGEKAHGAPITGAAWEAQVIRQAVESHGDAARIGSAQCPALAPLLQQAKALSHQVAPGQIIPVRAVLDLLHPGDNAASAKSEGQRASLDRRLLGTAAHALLERWDFVADPPIAEIAAEFFPNASGFAACARDLGGIVEQLRRSDLWNKLKGAATRRRELPFLFELGGVFLNGVLDALLDEETLVDYKLASPAGGRSLRHETQLRIYAAAVRAATGQAPQQALLYYMDSGQLIDVDLRPPLLDETIARASAELHARFAGTTVAAAHAAG